MRVRELGLWVLDFRLMILGLGLGLRCGVRARGLGLGCGRIFPNTAS